MAFGLRFIWLTALLVTLALWTRAPCATAAVAVASCKTHVVGEGHSLWKIARRYNVSVEAIREQNGIEDASALRVGQVLDIPQRSGRCRRPRGNGDHAPAAAAGTTSDRPVVAPPPAWTQTQKTAAERGVNPCMTPDPGWGVYDTWSRAPSMGQMIAPQRGGISRSGAFDVMFHFHGHEPVRKEWVKVMDGAVLVGIDLGIGSGPYDQAFAVPARFGELVRSVEHAMAEKTGNSRAHVRKVGLSAWSAGYGAVGRILSQPQGKRLVDTVVLLDGLHCGYQGKSLDETQLGPFIQFAQQAAAGRKLMVVSHSSIIPPGYASTTETAHFLIQKVGGRPRGVRPRGSDPMGLELISRYSRGSLHVRGYKGNDKMDHCAHIGLFKDILKVHVKRRWGSPRGRSR
ncbi:MAG: LysM peptidoglycan-binding domain-containing protein [Polyangiaceae bacterium]|jgi:LysM repeat protein|nr:LysM peptidoglycan-binding domain-containing protein [Polyangiaceae bacterium]